MNKLNDSNFLEIYPENLKKYKNLQTFAKNIEFFLKTNLINNIPKLCIYNTLEEQDDKMLDEIAWGWNIENYRDDLERETKIKLIKTAYWIHAKKGTKKAVEQQLKTLRYPIKIEEWFEFGGKPYTFRLLTEHIIKNKNWLKEVISLIEEYKNVRSILEAFYILKEKTESIKILGYKEQYIISKKINAIKNKNISNYIYHVGYKQIIKERVI